MHVRWFAFGVLVGLILAPASGRATWRMLRDKLARAIDAVLRLGIDTSSSSPRA
jgi:hypothetical protein